jgi:phospho-N-acetylmuramoyl-pentapeptide-transferase
MTDPHGIVAVAGGLLTGLIGFADDALKRARQDSAGLKARYKLSLQIVVGFLIAAATYYLLEDDTVRIPFAHVTVHLGMWKVLLGLFCYLTIVNGVNLTDGIDGLAGTTALIAAACLGGAVWTSGIGSAIAPVVLMGICAGFLPFNWHPAKIFMGDSGAFCLSGTLVAAAIALGMEISLLIIGLIFIIELVSVVLQVVYFRLTGGKRLFRMSPIHHAWELRGAKEPAIVSGFAAVGIVAGAIGWWAS